MGSESYLLRMKGKEDTKAVSNYLTSRLGFKPDLNQYAMTDKYSHYVLRDDRYVIECELVNRSPYSQISLRFALCNPDSVDEQFVAIASDLMSQFQMTAAICEELPADVPTEYDISDLSRFARYCTWSILRARQAWQKAYGSDEAGLSVSDACRKFLYVHAEA
jgi:hypothetical protein